MKNENYTMDESKIHSSFNTTFDLSLPLGGAGGGY